MTSASGDKTPRFALFAPTEAEFKDPARAIAATGRVSDGPFAVAVGRLHGRDAVVVRTGMGPRLAREAAERVLDAFTVTEALVAGFAAGADQTLPAAALVGCAAAADAGDPAAPRAESSPELLARAQATGMLAACGDAATVGAVVFRRDDKERIGRAHRASVLEMEGYPLISACRARGVPVLMVRAVFDPLDADLPDLSGMLDEAGEPRTAALMAWVARYPARAALLAELGERSKACRNALNAFVKRYLEG